MPQSFQLKLFEDLRAIHGGSATVFAQQVADTLQVSLDSAYRRIRAEKLLDINELFTLCRAFDYNIGFQPQADTAHFSFRSLKTPQDFIDQIVALEATMQQLKQVGGEITYAAHDIPLFYHFGNDKMLRTKMEYWLKEVIHIDAKLLTPDAIRNTFETLRPTAASLHEMYLDLKGAEIWSDQTVDGHLLHLRYYHLAGYLSTADFKELVGLTISQLNQLERIASSAEGHKQIYQSEVALGNNTIQAYTASRVITFLSYHTFNNLRTENTVMNEDTLRWLDSIKRKSTLLNRASAVVRKRFFDAQRKKCEALIY